MKRLLRCAGRTAVLVAGLLVGQLGQLQQPDVLQVTGLPSNGQWAVAYKDNC